jgi:hypothetical protein
LLRKEQIHISQNGLAELKIRYSCLTPLVNRMPMQITQGLSALESLCHC